MNKKLLITSLGWEPRFLDGIEDILENIISPSDMVIFHPSSFFRKETEATLASLKRNSFISGINLNIFDLNTTDHVNTWHTTEEALSNISTDTEVVLDITTMPRHLIWACLHFLEYAHIKVRCIYYPPKSYGEWLSSDSGKPKMAFRHSGIAYPDRPTCLLLFSGFETERAQQLIDFFEPQKIILAIQQGKQLKNEERCVTKLSGWNEVITTYVNAYSDIAVLSERLIDLIRSDIEQFNIVATTIGPRCSTLALYELNRKIPAIGLVYVNSHQYNINYSTGIDYSLRFDHSIDFTKKSDRI
jgi:hypothetical protein